MPQITIRPVTPTERSALQALLIRSKAYWGYDATFMAAVQDDLTLSPDYFERTVVMAAEADARLVGFYGLRILGAEAELIDLFIEPDTIGQGVGRRLWDHAVQAARRAGCAMLRLEADPHAEAFYHKMGAERIGVHYSTLVPGRTIPIMRHVL